MPKAEIQVKVLSRPVADSGLLRGCRAISHRITHTSERNLLSAGGVAGGTGNGERGRLMRADVARGLTQSARRRGDGVLPPRGQHDLVQKLPLHPGGEKPGEQRPHRIGAGGLGYCAGHVGVGGKMFYLVK